MEKEKGLIPIISEIIEDVKKDICDDYCRYSIDESLDEEKLWDICIECPLSRI